ncbi:uncharacterized protein LOC125241061 [Leguminivora glycinivorella]|uniref:uncharacterized protein LOC125241061 n=1 Tax=Leguminivora glycinivorella TaxID=1035111 RepID=UPI00200C5600|nr:uncharacterized protein LOC125241061 [Leguminivora glycinivorella]
MEAKICEESSDSEEEILVFAEFEDSVNMENYRSIHVLGISEKNPIIQLDDTIFTGQLESALGTYMFFARDEAPPCEDPLFDKVPKESMKYICKGDKYLRMKHTYITPKEGAETDIPSEPVEDEDNLAPISFKTVQDAIDTFKIEWKSKIQEADVKVNPNLDNNPLCEDQDMTDIDFKSEIG